MYHLVKGLYVPTFNQNNRKELGEYKILLPDKPAKDKDFQNYNLPVDKQKFSRDIIPPDLKTCSQHTQEDFVRRMYHKRKHGIWILIRDVPMYLTGLNWYFLNFWFCFIGRFPDFRTADVDFFQWWKFEIEKDADCYGGLLLKSRREGATEKALCSKYEYTSRVKNVHAGMQNMTDEDVTQDYRRILLAHSKMIWFFKPVNKGSDKPTDGLHFEMPSIRMTAKKVEQDFSMDDDLPSDFEPLNSKITFEATKIDKYDGQMLHRYRQGEFGKIKPNVMNILKRWEIVKPCLHLFNGQKIIGKALFESTVEELGDGEMLERTTKLWEMSDPNNIVNGRTESGMKRLFRNALDTAEPDEWGFPKKEQTKTFLEKEFARLEKQQKWEELSDLQRKNPITLAHALTPSISSSTFNSHKLKKRLRQLQEDLWWNDEPLDSWGNPVKDVRRRGDFIWENGRDSRVIWVDNPSGKWWVSQLLSKDDSNRSLFDGYYKIPGNKHLYGFGIDPINTKMPEGARMSKAAAALFRKLDMMVDAACFDKSGEVVRPGDMQTFQFVATYCVRPDEPNEFYEDMLMAAVYFGVECLCERQKAEGMFNHFIERGYVGYLAFRPDSTITGQTRNKEFGLPAHENVSEQYTQALMNYIFRFIDNCKHPQLIMDDSVGWLTYRNTSDSRTKHDLTVASGYALLAAGERPVQQQEQKKSEEFFERFNVMQAN